jgi:glycosyltransferase involved in cell wall biosynthesis
MSITVVIKTFLRPDACRAAVRSWLAVVPRIPIIVVDDGGDVTPDLTEFPSVTHIRTDFDIGLSAGRNIGVNSAETRYVVVADDDNACTRDTDLPAALDQLKQHDLGVLGVGAYWFKESGRSLSIIGNARAASFKRCDGTLNHFLGDREKMPLWDESLKVAGEHVDYFLECRRLRVPVAATPLMDFYRCRHAARKAPAAYKRYRSRSHLHIVKQKWGYRSIGRWGVKAPSS